ncbi:MAG: hypothetical protein ACYSXF_09345, partial [Planctomycetota bacterium]
MDPAAAREKARRPHRWLVRGESVIASTGLVLAAILLAVMSTTAYWTLRIQREALESARADEIQSLSILLGEMVTVLLEQGQLSTVRRLVTEAGHHAKLSECRLVLTGGQVVAAADPSEITLLTLPPTWSAGDAPEPPEMDGSRLR